MLSFRDERKLKERDAVSGPSHCAWSLTLTEFPVEHRSSSTNPAALTLVGNSQSEGILLLDKNPICDDGWNIEAAHVACKELRFSRAKAATVAKQANSDVFSLDEVKCRGNETTILDCAHQTNENCNSGEAAGVVCDTRSQHDIEMEEDLLTRECFANNIIFGPALMDKVLVVPTVQDCQDKCAATLDCNTFSYRKASLECRLHRKGEVEEPGHHQPKEAGRHLKEIQVKTDSESRAQCDAGECWVKMKLIDSDVRNSCETPEFSDLQPRALDRLNNSITLGSCHNKVIQGDLSTLEVVHTGEDGWTGQLVKIIFEDSSTAHCALGEFLDDTSSTTVACVFIDESGDSVIKKIDSYYVF